MKSLEDTDVVVSESLSLSSQESGLVAGDQSAACLAQVIFGHVGEEVYTEKRIYVSEILTFYIFFLILHRSTRKTITFKMVL